MRIAPQERTPPGRDFLDDWPLGAKYAVATLVLDRMDRCRRTSADAMRQACSKAAKAPDFATGLKGLKIR